VLTPETPVHIDENSGAESKATINMEKYVQLNKQIFFPCGGMAVVKSLLYVNKN
jgi:hypothetical protein